MVATPVNTGSRQKYFPYIHLSTDENKYFKDILFSNISLLPRMGHFFIYIYINLYLRNLYKDILIIQT